MTDLIRDSLLSQMSNKFNEQLQTNSELVKNLDYQETDSTLKWKTLINNTYAKKDREKRNKNRNNKDGEDSADDKSSVQQLPRPSSTSLIENSSSVGAGLTSDVNVERSEVMEGSKTNLIIGEKFGNNVKEKKIVIDDDLHTPEQKTAAATSTNTSSSKESDDEKNISTNLPQLNTNSQAIESTKVTTATSVIADKKHDNTVRSDGVSVALSDDDKRAGSNKTKTNANSNPSKTIDKTTSPRNLRSNRNSAATHISQVSTTPTQRQGGSMSDDKNKNDETKSDMDENEAAANEDSSATNDTAPSSTTPKKGRGRPKQETKGVVGLDVKNKSLADGGGEQVIESESDMSQKRGRRRVSRLRSIVDGTVEEKKVEVNVAMGDEEIDVKKETEMEEAPKRRGRSRKLVEEKEDKESEIQNEDDGSKSQDHTDSPKRKRGRFKKTSEAEATADDNKSEVSKSTENSDDVKPRLLMTIRTDKSAVPKIITAQPVTTPTTVDDQQEKIIKKRGRRPKATSITKPIQVKKSLRLAKDGTDANISENVNIRKEKPEPPILAPPIGRIRSQRRIKPTAKILANEELRQGFEVTNCKRLSLSNENLMEHFERSPTMSRSGNETSSNKSPIVSSPEKSPKIFHESNQEAEPNVILNKMPALKRPCRDPQDFINEIKTFKIGINRAPEENKKLTKNQQRRMTKAKEKHLGLLGLRPKNDHSDSSNESSTSEDFVPAKFSSRPGGSRTAITLRLRNQRAAEIHKRNLSMRKREAALAQKRMKLAAKAPVEIDMSDDDDCIVVESSKVSRNENAFNSNKENNSINLICSCHQNTKYVIDYTQSLAFTTNGKMFCCAQDEIESRKIGCTNELTDTLINLFRPSVKVSYMALCTSHKKRLVAHNCCSGCGIFCTQGTFVICSNKHFFHRNCATKYILNTPYEPNNPNYTGPTLLLKCPHCGIDAPDFDYRVTMRCENLPVFVQHRSSNVPKPAKMGNMLRNSQPNPLIQLNSLTLCIDKLIPETVGQILKAASDRLKSQHASTSDLSKMFAPKDIFYAIYRKDGDDRMAEIVSSGFNLMTPLKDFHNGTCLHLISNFGSLTMAYLILSRANSHNFVNLMDKETRTPIMYSVAGKKHEILKLLCQCGADVTLKGPDGMTVLHLAAKSGNLAATQIILENYRQIATISKLQKFINTTDDGHWTALVWAAENGHGEIVNYLISLGADPNICDSENNTVLHWACLAGKLEAIYPLVSNTDLNIQNIHGDTALHISARQSKTKICMLLMAHGASLIIRNLANETPLDVADDKSECAKLLKFNMDLRNIGIGGWKSHIGDKLVLCNDLSNGREVYPIQIVKNLQHPHTDEIILPDFKYITKDILLQNSIQIDQRVSQMRVCSCSDNCISEHCQCAQISLQNWYNIDGRLIANFNYTDPPMLFECNDVCQCNKLLCKNRVVQSGIKLPLVVFECDDKLKGFGVKSLIKIRKGSFVAQYTGEILTDQEADRRTDDSYFFDLGASDHCIDANFYGNVSRFFNHSCSSNIVPVRVYFDHQDLRFPKIAFFASRDIEAGEEIAFDYGEKFWMIKYKYFKCLCKSDKCRYSAETIDKTVAEYNQRSGALNN